MKFGKYLEAEQVPEWAKMYVDYDGLKQIIKTVAVAIEKRGPVLTEERLSLLKRASTYLGYDSLATGSPTAAGMGGSSVSPGQPPVTGGNAAVSDSAPDSNRALQGVSADRSGNCSRANCAKCSHFRSIVSASPQIAMDMSAGNTGKVAATSLELAHGANIKIPLSAQDSFTESVRQRRAPISTDCISADEFKKQLDLRLPEEQEFFEQMEQELIKVNDFYRQKQLLFSMRLENIRKQQRIYDEMLGEELEAATLRARPPPGKRSMSQLVDRSNTGLSTPLLSSGPSAQLRVARGKIKRAMLEVYRGMDMLKNYRILCYTAFIKALKKYQKTARWCDGTDYFLHKVDSCYMATSDLLNGLSAQVETMYVNRYAGGSRSKGMSKLRVNTNSTSIDHQGSVFRSGLMLGVSLPLIVRAIYEANLLSNEQRVPYHRQLLQIYGSIFLVLIFLLLFSLNIMAWTRAHINYRFIFEVDPRDYLNSWQFLEMSSFLFTIASIVLWANFALHIDHNSYIFVYVLLGVILGLFLMPVKAFYWTSRRWLIKSLWRILFSGFHRVEFRDFFLGDEMCSLTYTFSMVLLLGCASVNGWSDLDDVCNTTQWWSNAAFLMLPNLFRLLQCIRRFADSGDAFPHLANGAKYSSTIATIWLASANRIVGGTTWRSVWVASAIANSCFTSLWDLLMDWGLFESRTKHRFLRSELKFERTWLYYAAIVTDVILRFVWITQISPSFFSFGHAVHSATVAYVAAMLEVVRRFLWSFLRVENEHVSNCGQFRATTDIPLPFNPPTTQTLESEQTHNEFEHDYSSVTLGSPTSPRAAFIPDSP
ncbi:Xenotropic and polytropic retrovirus receptor 1 [Coemansia sp. IMI 209128]|nr:Xenotropic and polytropic retrovirus receptor 1 [Coemansia sp. IMI 209128]